MNVLKLIIREEDVKITFKSSGSVLFECVVNFLTFLRNILHNVKCALTYIRADKCAHGLHAFGHYNYFKKCLKPSTNYHAQTSFTR